LILQLRIFGKIDIILDEKSIEVVMNEPLNDLNEEEITPYMIPAGRE
jgi:hypothetical protein